MTSNRILILDDHLDTRDFLSTYLSSCNIPIAVAANRWAALEILSKSNEIACVLVDYNMPEMTAAEFVERVRSEYPNVRCILLTASKDAPFLAKELSVQEWVGKPISVEGLNSLVETYRRTAV